MLRGCAAAGNSGAAARALDCFGRDVWLTHASLCNSKLVWQELRELNCRHDVALIWCLLHWQPSLVLMGPQVEPAFHLSKIVIPV